MASRALSKELRAEITRGKRRVRENAEERADSQLMAAGIGVTLGAGAGAIIDAKFGEGGAATYGSTKIPINVTAGPALAGVSFFLDKGMVRSGLLGTGVGMGIVGGARMLADRFGDQEDDE